MPNIKSAMKRDAKSKVENARNRAQKTALKTVMKKFDAAVAEGNKEAAAGTYKVAVKSVTALRPRDSSTRTTPRTRRAPWPRSSMPCNCARCANERPARNGGPFAAFYHAAWALRNTIGAQSAAQTRSENLILSESSQADSSMTDIIPAPIMRAAGPCPPAYQAAAAARGESRVITPQPQTKLMP